MSPKLVFPSARVLMLSAFIFGWTPGSTEAAVVTPGVRIDFAQAPPAHGLEQVGPIALYDTASVHGIAARSRPARVVQVRVAIAALDRALRLIWRSPGARRFGRRLATELGISAAISVIERYLGLDEISEPDKRTLRELQRTLSALDRSVQRNGEDLAAIRREMERQHGYTLRRLEALDADVRRLDQRILAVERRLFREERRNDRQEAQLARIRRTLINQDGRIVRLERAVVEYGGRITDLEGRVLAVETLASENRVRIVDLEERQAELRGEVADLRRIVDRDGYYDKHVFGVGGQLLYPRPVSGGGGATLGASAEVSYLFNEYFGAFVQGVLAPTEAEVRVLMSAPDAGSPRASALGPLRAVRGRLRRPARRVEPRVIEAWCRSRHRDERAERRTLGRYALRSV